MKKIVATILVVFLVIGSFSALAANRESQDNIKIQSHSNRVTFSELTFEKTDSNYINLKMEDVSTYITKPGEPMLPKIVKTIELPFGVKNIEVKVNLGETIEQKISQDIKPTPMMLPLATLTNKVSTDEIKNLKTYKSSDPYPDKYYNYEVRSGLNSENKRTTFVTVDLYPVKYIPSDGILNIAQTGDIEVTYEKDDSKVFTVDEESNQDMVIITPEVFKKHLTDLEEHKDKYGVNTFIKTSEEIYNEYDGRDKPEQIKYFIKDAIENYDITYVLLVGGLKNKILAKPRDGPNYGASAWYLPVRYTNLYDKPKYPLNAADEIFDPGVISDLYFADIYDGENEFSSWDPNEDDIFAAWAHPNPDIKDDTGIDMVPDVYVGRLACRSASEVKTVVDKIITYESTPKDWFNKITAVSGDGFLDQEDLNFQWDTTGLKNGYYTIYAQSINDVSEEGPILDMQIQIDRSKKTSITFSHDDHLNPAIKDFEYPAPPIAEIVTISEGDILGYDNYEYVPGESEAYCNNFNPWANVSYVDGILTIRGKSYDPKPYGNVTDIHVWIKDSTDGTVVFDEWRRDTEMYYEGEWTTGEKELFNRGGAMYYMDGFEKEILWTSNGKFTGQNDVITELSKGSGFLFMSGHGSPNSWGDHYPGAPGNRQHGSVTGLTVTSLRPWPPFFSSPMFPMDTLSNGEKLPVAVIGGCHNSQFNVSMIPGLYDILPYFFDIFPEKYMWCHGVPVPECFSWRIVRNPDGGAIASIGNTGLGYGMPGKVLTVGGGDGWITIEFFRQYGEHGQTVLGDAHSQAIKTYIQTHDMTDLESGHPKTVQQWVLLGDPSLQMGGYE